MIAIEHVAPDDPRVLLLLEDLSDALQAITGSSGKASFDITSMHKDGCCLLLATLHGQPVGCGAVRPLRTGVAEIKRMFARPGTKGVGAALLAALEQAAKTMGYRETWLETRALNTRAVSFYGRHGYRRIENFGKYQGRPEAVCFAKTL